MSIRHQSTTGKWVMDWERIKAMLEGKNGKLIFRRNGEHKIPFEFAPLCSPTFLETTGP